ncbi:MAG: hypothetical protein EXR71_00835 [Myxococcales bacterium]|nr:hypothetical protein [Myxococcales bacterium]
MAESFVRIEPGSPIAAHLVHGAVVCLGAGVHIESLVIAASVTLRGEPGAVLDGARAGPVVQLDEDELTVVIEDLVLRGGAGEAGGGVRLSGRSELTLSRCTVEGNEAMLAGGGIGGGIYQSRGMLHLRDCRLRGNRARTASDYAIVGAARAEVRGGSFAGDIEVLEGAELTLVGCTVAGHVGARGTTTRAPVLLLRGAHIAGGVDNDANLPAAVTVEDG